MTDIAYVVANPRVQAELIRSAVATQNPGFRRASPNG